MFSLLLLFSITFIRLLLSHLSCQKSSLRFELFKSSLFSQLLSSSSPIVQVSRPFCKTFSKSASLDPMKSFCSRWNLPFPDQSTPRIDFRWLFFSASRTTLLPIYLHRLSNSLWPVISASRPAHTDHSSPSAVPLTLTIHLRRPSSSLWPVISTDRPTLTDHSSPSAVQLSLISYLHRPSIIADKIHHPMQSA